MVVLLLGSSYHLLCSQFYMVQGTLARTLARTLVTASVLVQPQLWRLGGVPDHFIKTLGRWSSNAYQIYIRTPVSSTVSVSSQLVA